jgi:hypothetical protein
MVAEGTEQINAITIKEKSAKCDRDKEKEGEGSRRHANQYDERKE